MSEAQTLAAKLREIVGQETTPPLWIYVTKDQIPDLLRAAELLETIQLDSWVTGFCAAGYMMTDQSNRFQQEWAKALTLSSQPRANADRVGSGDKQP